LRCDCEAPEVPPASAAPAPSVSDMDEPVDSTLPPVRIPGPPTAPSRTIHANSGSPPTDLVISLSRLTC
jgi:hypothetical protein